MLEKCFVQSLLLFCIFSLFEEPHKEPEADREIRSDSELAN